MINFKDITQAVETILSENLYPDYVIERNAIRPSDPYKASERDGWIGVYRGRIEYNPHTTGATPWMATVETIVEIQVASLESAQDCEDKLCDAEQAVMNVLTANKKLNGTVLMTNGYTVDYDINEDEQTYYQAAVITIQSEVRA